MYVCACVVPLLCERRSMCGANTRTHGISTKPHFCCVSLMFTRRTRFILFRNWHLPPIVWHHIRCYVPNHANFGAICDEQNKEIFFLDSFDSIQHMPVRRATMSRWHYMLVLHTSHSSYIWNLSTIPAMRAIHLNSFEFTHDVALFFFYFYDHRHHLRCWLTRRDTLTPNIPIQLHNTPVVAQSRRSAAYKTEEEKKKLLIIQQIRG